MAITEWRKRIALGGGVLLLFALAIWLGPQFWVLVRDEAALEQAIAHLGWLGPLALVVINVLQIIVAPIPGYVVQAVAGYVYGPF